MKNFKPTSWSIDNRTSIYVIILIITIAGIMSYNKLQKEKFPDIVIPTIYVGTIYPGTSPADMENLVTRPIEKQIKAISGVRKVTSNSVQDYSMVSVEFNTGILVADAKQKVKDAVDKAQTDLPTDLPTLPNVQEVNFSEFPVMFVNLSGDIEMNKLKKYAEDLQDKIETYKEITRVDIVGALDKEIQVDVDMYKMQAAKVTFGDIERGIQFENMTISAGTVKVGDMKRSIRISGQYSDPNLIGDIVVKSVSGAPIYLKDIATVKEGFKERESFARLDHKPVITLNIIKRSGENLIETSDNVQTAVAELKKTEFPKDLTVTITGDQSTSTRNTLNDLINTIIIGFILVTLILMFFMGTTNALFVALSVPLSTFLAFLVMPLLGGVLHFSYTLNMMVLFSFLLALGIVVDDAIVVIENTHRIFHQGKQSIIKSAKYAAAEVFIPVMAGTLTTLAPFFPLLFWPGIIGKFMYYLPLTLIVVLAASLIVAYIMNPVFAVSFMRKNEGPEGEKKALKTFRRAILILVGMAALFYIGGNRGMGNLIVFITIFIVLNKYVFNSWIHSFQTKLLPGFMNGYERLLRWMLDGKRPYAVFASIFLLLIISFMAVGIRKPKVVFFPSGDPNFVYTYIQMPIGTDQAITDSITRVVEKRIYGVIGEHNEDVESVISNVAVGAGDPQNPDRSVASNKGKVSVAFKEFAFRKHPHTSVYLDKIRDAVKGIPVAQINVAKESNGPPVGKPINIEITGDNYEKLIKLTKDTKRFIDEQKIAGIEDLRSDLQDQNPEISIDIDRVRANREGISTGQVGMELRTAIFGFEASKFKRGEDEYPIQVRYSENVRKNIDALADLKITYRDMASGMVRQIPLSSVAKVNFSNTLGSIKRINLKRVVTLSSNVLSNYNANEIVGQIKTSLEGFNVPDGYEIKMTGEQQDQKETGDFLGLAGMMAFGLIFLILVLLFNSVSKPLIIISEILFSIIGVLLGFAIFKMDISIIMTGVGIVALCGIVVKNGILLVEFTDHLKAHGEKTTEAIVHGGKTRLIPVILTATATILGLVPLALGININFFTLFTDFNPHFYLGGESVVFWGPLAWTIIFGLGFATFLTLLVVPVMYLISYRIKIGFKRRRWLAPKLVE
jgi:multidrug efflux pump